MRPPDACPACWEAGRSDRVLPAMAAITNLYRCATCGTVYRKDGAAWVFVSAPSRPHH